MTGGIYANSCSDHDGFDVFGAGGEIRSPDIKTVGGWETHDGDLVYVNGIQCPNPPTKYTVASPPTAGCPLVKQPILADPFAGQITDPQVTGTTPQGLGTAFSKVHYSPVQKLVALIDNLPSTTSLHADGTAIIAGDTIQIDNEQMSVQSVSPFISTFAITKKQMTNGVATITTSTHDGLSPGDTATVSVNDPHFDGTVTVIAQGGAGKTFTYNAPTIPVTNQSISAGTVTLTTNGNHGFANGDSVDVNLGEMAYDGAVTLTGAPSTTTVTYNSPTIAIKSWSLTSNVVTLTTASPHGLSTGDTITVSNYGGGRFYERWPLHDQCANLDDSYLPTGSFAGRVRHASRKA